MAFKSIIEKLKERFSASDDEQKIGFKSTVEKLKEKFTKSDDDEKTGFKSIIEKVKEKFTKSDDEKTGFKSIIEKIKALDNNKKIIAIFSFILILLLVVTIASWPNRQDEDLGALGAGNNEPSGTEVGELSEAEEEQQPDGLAPDFTLTLLTGEEFTLSDHRGTVVVLSFWATWCGPCVEKMSYTQASAEHFGNQAIFLGINIGENPDLVQTFLDEGGYTFLNGVDENGNIFNNLYTSGGIPYSVIIGPDGMIVDEMVGWAYSMSNELRAIVEEAQR